jgi:hypothetical protein
MQGTCPNVLIVNLYCSSIDYAYHSLIVTMKFYAFDQRITHPRFGMQQLWQRALAMLYLYLYWANLIFGVEFNYFTKDTPKPREPEASVCKFKVSEACHSDNKKKKGTIPIGNKLFPHPKILEETRIEFNVVMWFLNISGQINHALKE